MKKYIIQQSVIKALIALPALVLSLGLLLGTPSPASARAMQEAAPTNILSVGAAFLTQIAIHESGHYVVGYMAKSDSVSVSFFTQKDGNFFMGLTEAQGLDPKANLSYRMGGEAASSYLFEASLRQYRTRPTVYNTSLMFFSGTDFLWYSVWSFYIQDSNNPAQDPVGIAQETGLSRDTVFGMAVMQTAINAYRAFSGNDTVTPFIALNDHSASFGVQVRY